jgi:HD-like signal output (HDOD) protein
MVRDAVLRLGGGTVVSLAVGGRVRGPMSVALPAYHLAEGELWRHSVATALAAEIGRGACRAHVPAECFTSALLHDVGKLVLVRFLSPELEQALGAARGDGRLASLDAEREVLGVHHGELGELIAQRWQLPETISKPLAAHHAPSEDDGPIADIVHVADVVATRIGAGCNDATEIDPAVMVRLGLEPEAVADLEQNVAASFETVMRRYEG